MISLVLCYDTQGVNKREPKDLWQEPFVPASTWRPCADQRNWEPSGDSLSLCARACVCVSESVCMRECCECICMCVHGYLKDC